MLAWRRRSPCTPPSLSYIVSDLSCSYSAMSRSYGSLWRLQISAASSSSRRLSTRAKERRPASVNGVLGRERSCTTVCSVREGIYVRRCLRLGRLVGQRERYV